MKKYCIFKENVYYGNEILWEKDKDYLITFEDEKRFYLDEPIDIGIGREYLDDKFIVIDQSEKIMKDFPWFEARNVWTGEKLGFPHPCECQSGWCDLIYNLCKELDQLYKNKKADISNLRIYQIKEKYGLLDFNIGNYIEGAFEITQKYHELSGKVCEECGSNNGEMHIKGAWVKTLCQTCAEKDGFVKCKNKY